MRLSVVTPKGEKVAAEVSMVTAPGELGELGILPGHRALFSGLGIGTLAYVSTDGHTTRYLAINDGFVEIHDDAIVVVTETAEEPDEIDVERARRSRDEALALVESIDPLTDKTRYQLAESKLLRADNRLAVAAQYATPGAIKALRDRAA